MSSIAVVCTDTSTDRELLEAARDQARVVDYDAIVLVHYLYAPRAQDAYTNPPGSRA